MKTGKYFALGLMAALAAPSMSIAATYDFSARLDSAQASSAGASDARGQATLSVNDVSETMTFILTVMGISLDDLGDSFVSGPAAAFGPIHVHDGDAGQPGPVVVPFAFNASYTAKGMNGFEVQVTDYAYSDAVAVSGSPLSFDAFLTDLQRDGAYVNIHTDAYGGGEIRGQLSANMAPVPLPAGLPLLVTTLGGLALIRRRR